MVALAIALQRAPTAFEQRWPVPAAAALTLALSSVLWVCLLKGAARLFT
jgi:hypothetical protein